MKAKKLVSSVLAATILLGACAAPKQSTTSPTLGKASSSDSMMWNETSKGKEHCLASDKSTCFLEVDTEGKSQFFATGESYTKLLIDPILAEIHIDLKPTDGDEYARMKTESSATVVYEGPESNAANIYSDTVDESSNFIFLIFRIVSFLWKGSQYVDKAITIGSIAAKIGQKFSSFKDKLKSKLGIGKDDEEKEKENEKEKEGMKGMTDGTMVDTSKNEASGVTARLTWHLGQQQVTKELPIPAEYITVTAAEKKAAEEAAAEIEAEMQVEEAVAQ